MQKILPNIVHTDERGKIETIFAGKNFREINRFHSKKGIIRGNHYHKETEELIFLIKGEVLFKIKSLKHEEEHEEEEENQIHETTLLPGDALLIEPYELHTAEIKKDSEWISCLTKEYNHESPDIYEEEKDDDDDEASGI